MMKAAARVAQLMFSLSSAVWLCSRKRRSALRVKSFNVGRGLAAR